MPWVQSPGDSCVSRCGTGNQTAASTVVNRIERAVAEGNSSSLWPELKRALPPNTFAVLAKIVNYTEAPAEKIFQWEDLNSAFAREMQQRIALDKLRDSRWERYQQTLNAFATFLKEQNIFELRMMNRPFIESSRYGGGRRFSKRSFPAALGAWLSTQRFCIASSRRLLRTK